MSYCQKKLRKQLEKIGLNKSEANFEIWKTKLLVEKKYGKLVEKTEEKESESKNEEHWNKANVDDTNRANEEGLKKHGDGQWGDKTERCIHGQKKKGKSLSSAIGICRKSTKDK